MGSVLHEEIAVDLVGNQELQLQFDVSTFGTDPVSINRGPRSLSPRAGSGRMEIIETLRYVMGENDMARSVSIRKRRGTNCSAVKKFPGEYYLLVIFYCFFSNGEKAPLGDRFPRVGLRGVADQLNRKQGLSKKGTDELRAIIERKRNYERATNKPSLVLLCACEGLAPT